MLDVYPGEETDTQKMRAVRADEDVGQPEDAALVCVWAVLCCCLDDKATFVIC